LVKKPIQPNTDHRDRLKLLSEVMGWSPSELARRFGVTKSAVSQWLSGESQMSGPAVKLLEVFEKKAAKFEES
jgi:DNA-binding transcriptional regulator YiaG